VLAVALDTCVLGPLALLIEMYSTIYIRASRRRFIPRWIHRRRTFVSPSSLLNNHMRLLFIRTLNMRYSTLDI
jgi:hypothetical protein